MPKINDHNSRETARMELRGIDAVLEAMDHRQLDVIYLADLLHDYQGNAYRGGCGWQLSRATGLRIKAMLSEGHEKWLIAGQVGFTPRLFYSPFSFWQ